LEKCEIGVVVFYDIIEKVFFINMENYIPGLGIYVSGLGIYISGLGIFISGLGI